MERFSITTTVKKYPHLPYETIKNDILGKTYQLSLVFIGEKRAQMLNKKTRNKSYTPNILSFPLTDKVGEIFISPVAAKKEAPDFNLTYKNYVGYLFIHGLLHLKGFDHGKKMERLEQKFMNQFQLS